MTIVLAILALGVLIVVHEWGHYWVARRFGMRVERFSVGFGPKLIGWKRGDTIFQLAPIPFGGFVQITGMNPHDEYDPNDKGVYPNKPTWQRFLTIFAGPLTNVLFAVVLIFAVLAVKGDPRLKWQVDELTEGSPAAAVLQKNDYIVKIDGDDLYWSHKQVSRRIAETQSAGNREVAIEILRDGRYETVLMTPKLKEDGKTYQIGIKLNAIEGADRIPVGLGDATGRAFMYPIHISKLILGGFYDIITGAAPADAIGPVGITEHIAKSIELGWATAFQFLALLNVYLGLFNLLPLPALDGGRLAFLTYELATRRRPNPKVEAAVHMAGFLVFAVLMVLVLFKDIKNLFV